MAFVISKKVWLYLTVIGVAVILLFSIALGQSRGQSLAQSEVVLHNAKAMALGLRFFYQDQNRYPTALEFEDRNLMLNYFDSFPPQKFLTSSCVDSFNYKRPAQENFTLNFCLPTGVENFAKGWSSFNQDTPVE